MVGNYAEGQVSVVTDVPAGEDDVILVRVMNSALPIEGDYTFVLSYEKAAKLFDELGDFLNG